MELKAHPGALLRRGLYALGIVAVGIGLSFACQYYWHVTWYVVTAVVGGIVGLGMVYNRVSTLRTRVRHMTDGRGLEIVDGLSSQPKVLLYQRMQSYATKPSRWNDRLGCVEVVLTAYTGASDSQEICLCLSKRDADALLDDLNKHLQR